MKKYVFLSFIVFIVFAAGFFSGCSFTDSQWGSYSTSSGATRKNNANISSYYDQNGKRLGIKLNFIVVLPSVEIPEEIAGEKVVALDFSDVASKSSTTSISFPDSVIEFSGLDGFSSLQTLRLSKNLVSIEQNAFQNTSSFRTLILPSETPPEIPSRLFGDASSSESFPNLSIYVPQNSLDSYINAENWSDYQAKLKGYTEN